uniref:C2H2-type domain-containing protein n=1 Tax=Stomoxys calcitrans TaxID=35570 RepID=A0A1I8NX24_STOCA
MLNMAWEQRLQYICEKCWQHLWEFQQFQQSIIESQKSLYLNKEAAKEVGEVVKITTDLNIKDEQLEWHNSQEFKASTDDLNQPTVLTFDIKTEEPLDLNSDYEEMSPQSLQQLTLEAAVPLISHMSNRKENTSLTYDDESNEDCMSSSSLGYNHISSSEGKVPTTKRSVEEFDELVALWRSSLECQICHQLIASYSRLEQHFGKKHASEGCYLTCCQLKLETRYDIERHIHYHNAPQQLKCDACCKAYRLEKHLKSHKRNVHTSKGGDKDAKDSEKLEAGKYHCSKCLKDFATKARLNNHSRDAHKPKIFECNICERSFMHQNALRDHLAKHKGEKTHACSFCPKAFTCRAYFCLHMRKSHPQEWKKMHKEPVKREKEYRQETRGESIIYVCIYCSMEYDKQDSMHNHLHRCSRKRDGRPIEYAQSFRLETRAEGVVCVCIYCSKVYEKRLSMLNHIRQCQIENGPMGPKNGYRREARGYSMVYVCMHCSKEYEKRQSIYSHLRKCQIELRKRYRLKTCGESMVYVCISCSQEYANLQSMSSHLYQYHRDNISLAASTISEPPVQSEQQQESLYTTRIIDPKPTDVSNITPEGDTLNELDKEGGDKEESLMAPMEGKELKDENSTSIYVKTEQFPANANALRNEEMNENEMTQEFEELIKSEEEFMDL